MNNNYYKEFNNNPIYTTTQSNYQMTKPYYSEYTYQDKKLDDILKINKGKKVSVYTSFKNSNEWKDKIFTGIIEDSYKDYIVLSDPKTGTWYIIPIKCIGFIKSEECINNKQEYYKTNISCN